MRDNSEEVTRESLINKILEQMQQGGRENFINNSFEPIEKKIGSSDSPYVKRVGGIINKYKSRAFDASSNEECVNIVLETLEFMKAMTQIINNFNVLFQLKGSLNQDHINYFLEFFSDPNNPTLIQALWAIENSELQWNYIVLERLILILGHIDDLEIRKQIYLALIGHSAEFEFQKTLRNLLLSVNDLLPFESGVNDLLFDNNSETISDLSKLFIYFNSVCEDASEGSFDHQLFEAFEDFVKNMDFESRIEFTTLLKNQDDYSKYIGTLLYLCSRLDALKKDENWDEIIIEQIWWLIQNSSTTEREVLADRIMGMFEIFDTEEDDLRAIIENIKGIDQELGDLLETDFLDFDDLDLDED